MPICARHLGLLGHRLLDPILPEIDGARLHRHSYNLRGKGLSDRNQGHRLRIATAFSGGRNNALPHFGQPVSDVASRRRRRSQPESGSD